MRLRVRGLDGAAAFYRDRLGLAELAREDALVRLGAGGRELVVLEHVPEAPLPGRATGLYHLAILLPGRRDLAAMLRHLAQTGTRLSGASDHLVSEALYLADPEGNGIEIYRDRPRAEWPRDEHGVAMATEPLDVESLLAEGSETPAPWRMPDGTRMGHVHLKVDDVRTAESFYIGTLGFALMARYGHAASFVSAGGYHHHVGFNTWESAGAAPPPEGAAGLVSVELVLANGAARDAVVQRIRAEGVAVEARDGGVLVRDPAGNALLLSVRQA